MEKLRQYRRKRDFSKTPEPLPEKPQYEGGPLGFVVQKHAARRLHFDFRLECDGVLKSWALPKGPSLDPKDKRLAVRVEDHPLEYADFEGVIPEGEYGAGTVVVWDKGVYLPTQSGRQLENREAAQNTMRRGLEQGKLSFVLHGKKLRGEWALVHMKNKNWLLIKHQDEYADEDQDILGNKKSVKSGHELQHLMDPSSSSARKANRRSSSAPSHPPGAKATPFPKNMHPMLATLADTPFTDDAWLFEPKLDGIRAIGFKDGPQARLVSRNGREIGSRFPHIVESLRQQHLEKAVIDGEIIAPDARGRPSFQLLQKRIGLTRQQDIEQAERDTPVRYYVFDLVYLDGYDLRGVKLRHRKAALEQAIVPSEHMEVLDYLAADGEILYKAALEQGLEGIIAKRADSLYEAGGRSRRWLKIKRTRSDDFVIGGYTLGKGSRAKTFGSLLLGYYGHDQQLKFAGAVGTGFDERTLEDLKERLDKIRTANCPFNDMPDLGLPANWVEPAYVAEVKFAQWTRDKRLRAPVFLRLRPDKPISQVNVQPPTGRGQMSTRNNADDPLEILDRRLENSGDAFELEVSGNAISLSNLGKTLWPAANGRQGITKRDYLRYLVTLSPVILLHLRDRPLTLSRYPDGIHGEQFFQKDWANPLPDYVHSVLLPSEYSGREVHYVICNNLATLLWLGQLANLEWHAWFSRIDTNPDAAYGSGEGLDVLDYPDFLVFDIDPYVYSGDESPGDAPQLNPKAFDKTRQVALWLKDKLDSLSLSSFVKTSGATGLHVYVPILRQFDHGAVRSVAETICTFLLHEHPGTVTLEWAVDKRRGRIFLDYNQNVRGKTLAIPYSPRATAGATVSTPVEWDDLPGVYPTDFTLQTVPQRLSGRRDPWLHILEKKNNLATLLKDGIAGSAAG